MNAKFVVVAALAVVSIAAPLTSRAATLQVACDNPSSKLPTINSALKLLDSLIGNLGPNTINVSGACNENIVIDDKANLTINAQNGASITDASAGTKAVIDVERTTDFHLNGFAIRGGGGTFNTAILCIWNSTCYFSNNNVRHPSGVGIGAFLGAAIALDHDVVEQSGTGLAVISGSRANAIAATIRNNTNNGVNVFASSFFNAVGPTTVANNGGDGFFVWQHSQVLLSGTAITGNGSIGVFANEQSDVNFFVGGNTISGNGIGVAVQDMSWAGFFDGATVVSGSANPPDINCWGAHSGARLTAANGTTNCPQP